MFLFESDTQHIIWSDPINKKYIACANRYMFVDDPLKWIDYIARHQRQNYRGRSQVYGVYR